MTFGSFWTPPQYFLCLLNVHAIRSGQTGHSWLYLLVTQFVRLKVRSEMIPANQKIVSLMFLWIRVFQYHWYKFDLENFQLLLNSKEVAQILEVQSHDPVEAEGSVEHPPLWNSSTPHTLPRQRHRLYSQPTLARSSSEKVENKWNKNLPRRPPGSNASKTLTARNQPNLCKVASGVALVKC